MIMVGMEEMATRTKSRAPKLLTFVKSPIKRFIRCLCTCGLNSHGLCLSGCLRGLSDQEKDAPMTTKTSWYVVPLLV